MKNTLPFWLKLLSGIAFLAFSILAIQKRDLEHFAYAFAALVTFVGSFLADRKKPKPPTMRQRGGNNSTNYQAGGNMTIHPKP